jgi:PTH1 family peptidyl-tRNA hydrolase
VWTIVGLGNPGKEYESTRHNVGFDTLIQFESKLRSTPGYFNPKKQLDCEYFRGKLGGDDCYFVAPQLYMNRSGEALKSFLNYFRLPLENLIVIADELDLDPGVMRLKKGGSSAGQRGVQNIIDHLGTTDFYRLRLGIGHPKRANLNSDVTSWVLGKPSKADAELIQGATEKAVQTIEVLIKEGFVAAQRFGN